MVMRHSTQVEIDDIDKNVSELDRIRRSTLEPEICMLVGGVRLMCSDGPLLRDVVSPRVWNISRRRTLQLELVADDATWY
jgi:hypothetical protein